MESMKKKSIIGFLVLVVAAIGGIYWYTSSTPPADIDVDEWVTYTNNEFGFSLRHPSSWQVHEAPNDLITPKFNIYKPGSDTNDLPYIHHSQNVTHVSVFPQGVPTEGVFGESRGSSINFNVPTINARDYTLSNGSVWATYAGVIGTSDVWNESGFIFAGVPIINHTRDCLRDGVDVPQDQCDPLTGDQVIHHGSINENDRRIQEEILASFRLIELENEEPSDSEREVMLYYYNPALDQDAQGNILCSRQGLVAVERTIPTTQTPIQDTIRLLLEGGLSPAERAQGISTEYPLSGFQLTGASLSNGTLTLGFEDPQNLTVGGSCRVGVLWFQIETTARQFNGVQEVRFQPETLFQP